MQQITANICILKQNIIYYLIVTMGPEFREGTAGVTCLCSMMSVVSAARLKTWEAGLIWRLSKGWRIHFQDSSLTWLAGPTGKLAPLHVAVCTWAFHRAVECSYSMADAVGGTSAIFSSLDAISRNYFMKMITFLHFLVQSKKRSWILGKII